LGQYPWLTASSRRRPAAQPGVPLQGSWSVALPRLVGGANPALQLIPDAIIHEIEIGPDRIRLAGRGRPEIGEAIESQDHGHGVLLDVLQSRGGESQSRFPRTSRRTRVVAVTRHHRLTHASYPSAPEFAERKKSMERFSGLTATFRSAH